MEYFCQLEIKQHVELPSGEGTLPQFSVSAVESLRASLVPRPLPDFILQPWRKIGRRSGIKTTSRTGNGGLG